MKQTSSALTFLLAQYRAIFKRAYIKGIASAVILTAGLAAGQAQAAEIYGYTNSIVDGWKDDSTSGAYVEFGEENIADILSQLNNNQVTGITNADKVISGGITHYSGAILASGTNEINVPDIKFLNIIGATNTELNSEKSALTLTSNVNGANLTVGTSGDVAMNIVRAEVEVSGQKKQTGGAVFAGMAMSYNKDSSNESPTSVSVTNSTLNVKDGYYADDAVIAGYALHAKSGTASVSGNTLNYTSDKVKQSTLYGTGRNPGIPSTMLAGGYARSAGGSADAKSNHMVLTGDAKDPTNITEKSYFGGGYATLYKLDGGTSKTNNSVEASGNTAKLTNLKYDAESNTGKEAFIFGGMAKNQVDAADVGKIKAGVATASNNELTLTDVAITTQATDTSVSIYGGAAINSSLSEGTNGSSTVKASGNKLTIDAKNADGTDINMSAATDDAGVTIVGGLAEQLTSDKKVSVESSNNTLTIQGNVKLTNVDLYGARAINSVTDATSGGFTTAVGNVLNVTGNAVLTDTSIIAAAIKAVDNASGTGIKHEGNKAIVDSGVLVIANDGKTVNIAGDETDIKGTVWAKSGGTVAISGIINEGTPSDKFFTGTGSLTGKLYNQGTVNVLNELDISQGKIYALTDKAMIHVAGDKSNFVDGDDLNPMDKGYATLKTTEQQIKDYLTADSATNISLPVEKKGDKANIVEKSFAGILKVSKGGTVDFGTEVTLSNFNFNNDHEAENAAGSIVVDASNSAAYFKADTLNVAHALAENATTQTDITKLTAVNASQVHLVANTLNLGATGLNSSESAQIDFDHALVKENINFLAATSGKDTGINAAPDDINTGYHLTTKVIGSNFMKTNDQNSKLEYYTALKGNVNGQVTITSGGSLEIVDGHWTANDQITVASGGSLVVGGTSKAVNNVNDSLPDATLTTSGVVLDVTVAGGDAKVTADGTDHVSDWDGPGDNRDVILDLTSGLTMQGEIISDNETFAGKTTISAVDQGVIRLNATDVNTILGQNHNANDETSGAFFVASGAGVLQVEGEINARFSDFDGDANTNGFTLDNGGILEVTTLNVENANVEPTAGESYKDDADYIDALTAIEFEGTVRADDVLLNDLQLTVKSGGSTSYASQVKVGSGTLEVAKSLSSVNDTVILGDASGANLVLNSDVVGDEGTVDVNTLRVDSGSITVENGVWTAQDITLSGAGTSLTVGGDTETDLNGNETEASLTFNHLAMGEGSTFAVQADGKATVTTADFSGLNTASAVRVAGVLTIIGASVSGDTTNGVHFSETAGSISIENNGSLRFDNLATNGAILADGDYSGTTINLQNGYTQIANNGGELYLNFDSGSSFDDEAIIAFKNALFTAGSFAADGMLKDGGILNIGAASFKGFNITERLEGTGLDGYTATWEQVKGFSNIYGNDVTNDVKNITNIRAIGLIDTVKGSWGSLSMVSGVATGAQVNLDGNTWLNYATGNNGFFISNHDHSAALGAKVASQKSLFLVNGGAIGHITLENGSADVERNYTTLDIADGDTTIESITASNNNASTDTYATRVNVRSNTTVTGEDGIRDVGEVNVLNGATLTSTQADIQELWVEESTADISGTLTVNGDGTAEGDGEALALGGQIKAGSIVLEDASDLNAAHGGTITTESVTVANNNTGSTIQVGFDIDTITDIISEEHENSYYTGTGYLEVSKYLDLNGASLVVDPAYDEATSVAAVMNFKNGQDKTYDTVFNDVGIVNGQVLVGKNAALGIGATLAETREAIATYQNNGALDANKYGSILYLNGQLTLDGNSEIALNSDANVKTLDGIRDSLKYTITSQVQDQYADLGLGKNTAILMTEAAFENEKGEKTGVAISFDRTNAVVNGQGGDIVLVGAFDASQTLNFFKDKDGEGHEGAYIAGQDIKVYTQNGFLYTTLKAGTEDGYGKVLHVDTDRAFQVMSEASDPVVNTLISYHEDRLPADSNSGNDAGNDSGDDTVAWTEIQTPSAANAKTAEPKAVEAKETTELTQVEPPANTAPTTKVTGSSSFLNEVVTASHGAPAEQAARLAVYGGAAQVGLAAAGSNSDVLESRFGIGANAQSLNLASNGMGGTLWVAPIYKSQDSDGFGAQGLEYGVDFDLYGVALGGDYKVTNEITVGAMFNVGSGSLDGQGNAAAAGTSNDFDYFGFALYGAYQAGALTVTGDLSYTQVDNDLEGSNEVGKLTASSDTSAWSLGVTGQYAFSFASIDVTPHAGLRFTSLDLDDYSLEAAGHGQVANYDGDTLSVFSIPVGVTFAKTIEGESWNVTPALDLHVTGQFGDDEAEGSVAWTGTNLSTNVSSEIFDSFTYGATVGIQAESNSFSFGVGLGYTGSSNVDEFSAQANARFTF